MTLDFTCYLAAILFLASDGVYIAARTMYMNRSNFNYEQMKDLNPDFIQLDWEFRTEHRGLGTASHILSALGWFAIAVPLVQIAWIQSFGGKRLLGVHAALAALAVSAALTEFVSNLLFIGMSSAMYWIVEEFNLDNWSGSNDEYGWRVLQLIHLVTRGLLMWVDAVEWLFMAIIMVLLYISVRTGAEGTVSLGWARLGLIIGALCILDFATSVLRYEDWQTFTEIMGAITAFNRIILLPLWLFWFSPVLGRARHKFESQHNMEELARLNGTSLSEVQPAPAPESADVGLS